MTAQTKATIKATLETGDRPTQAQFEDLIDSYQDVSANLTTLAAVTPGATGLALLDDTTAGGALTTLGVTAFAQTMLDDANAAATRATLEVISATATAEGLVELATDAEALTGTSTTRAVTPANLFSLVATKALQEAATSLNNYTSPGRQHNHPGHPKAWWVVTQTATPTLDDSYNVTSITDVAAGVHDITLTTAFSGATYCVIGNTIEQASGASGELYVNVSRATNAIRMAVTRLDAAALGVRTDTGDPCFGVAFGDQ